MCNLLLYIVLQIKKLFKNGPYLSACPRILASHQGQDCYKVALLCFTSLNNNAPAYIKDLIVPYTSARMLLLRSSSSNLLSTVSSKKYGERAFTFSGPQIWNSLPEKGLEKFKKSLKTYLCHHFVVVYARLTSTL